MHLEVAMNKPQSLVSFILPCHPLKGHKETLFIRYTDAERPLMPICPKSLILLVPFDRTLYCNGQGH